MSYGSHFVLFGAGVLSGVSASYVALRSGFAVATGRMTERRANSAAILAAAIATLIGVALSGCPDTPSPRWPEQHHAGAR